MKHWILPSNSKKFRMEAALRANNGLLDWRVKNLHEGDIVFMYKTMPDGCIKYMMEVVKANFGLEESLNQEPFWIDRVKFNRDAGVYARLKLLDVLDEKKLTLQALRMHGLKGNIQTKRSCSRDILNFILEA